MIIELSPKVDALHDRTDRRAFGGKGRLAGDFRSQQEDGRAKILNIPSRIQITVLVPFTFEVVARTVSRTNGSWQVLFLDTERRFTVIGSDLELSVNSAIQDWVQPEPLEP